MERSGSGNPPVACTCNGFGYSKDGRGNRTFCSVHDGRKFREPCVRKVPVRNKVFGGQLRYNSGVKDLDDDVC